MYEVAPVSATIWFWSFLLSMVFVLMNLLLVIIIDHYLTFKNAIGPTPTILTDAIDACSDLIWRLDWRKDQFQDSEYKACFLENPTQELPDELAQASNVSEEMEIQSRANCLGLKISRKQMEDMSAEGLAAEGHPGAKVTDNRELRGFGCDAQTAEHVLEMCADYVEQERQIAGASILQQTRSFVKLLRGHRMELTKHCEAIEAGIAEEQDNLMDSLDRLEISVLDSLEAFQYLRETGVESLAPPPPGQTGIMKATGAFQNTGAKFLMNAGGGVQLTKNFFQ